jgi:hypothetical protein
MADEQPNQVRENEPPDLGFAEPDTGQGDVESEIPEGVDALSEEAKSAAQERGGGGDDGDDGGAIDVSAIVAEEGDDAPGDAEAAGDDDAEAAGDDDAEAGAAADEAGDDATEKTDVEAQVAPDTGEDA